MSEEEKQTEKSDARKIWQDIFIANMGSMQEDGGLHNIVSDSIVSAAIANMVIVQMDDLGLFNFHIPPEHKRKIIDSVDKAFASGGATEGFESLADILRRMFQENDNKSKADTPITPAKVPYPYSAPEAVSRAMDYYAQGQAGTHFCPIECQLDEFMESAGKSFEALRQEHQSATEELAVEKEFREIVVRELNNGPIRIGSDTSIPLKDRVRDVLRKLAGH